MNFDEKVLDSAAKHSFKLTCDERILQHNQLQSFLRSTCHGNPGTSEAPARVESSTVSLATQNVTEVGTDRLGQAGSNTRIHFSLLGHDAVCSLVSAGKIANSVLNGISLSTERFVDRGRDSVEVDGFLPLVRSGHRGKRHVLGEAMQSQQNQSEGSNGMKSTISGSSHGDTQHRGRRCAFRRDKLRNYPKIGQHTQNTFAEYHVQCNFGSIQLPPQ